MDRAPDSWVNVALSEVVAINPGIDKSRFSDDDELPFVPMPAVEAGTGRIDTSERRPFKKVKSGFTAFAPGDVLFAKITPCMENGKMALVPDLPEGVGFGTTEFHVLRPTKVVDARLLYYFVSSASVRHEAQHNMTGAVGQKRVPKRFLEIKEFPLPPLNEQHRIVERIETLFARIDKGEEALHEVQKLLKRYRQSILKAAVTGELTRDWREANQNKLEPASDLLARILEARRENWQGRGKYNAPIELDSTDLPDLPARWTWTSLDQLICHVTSGSRDWKKYCGRGNGTFIMAQNVRPARFDDGHRVPVDPPEDGPDALRSEARLNDLLITIVGANTGDVCRFPLSERKHYVCQSVALIRPSETRLSRFLETYLSAEDAGRKVLDKFIYGAGRPHLSFEQLRALPVPLPPLAEAAQIAAGLEVLEERMRKLESEVSAQMTNAASLRQSILKSAFTGQLVPQDPNDEPASELLARIRRWSTNRRF